MRVHDLIDKLLAGYYPAHNYRGIPLSYELRRFRVTAVRIIKESPLTEMALTERPTLIRGETLLTGWDIDKNAERSFYLERFRDGLEEADVEWGWQVVEDGQVAVSCCWESFARKWVGATIRRFALPEFLRHSLAK